MNKLLFNVVFILLIALPLQADQNAWIKETIDLTINTQFDLALYTVENRIKQNPEDYRAYFYLAATLNSKMIHFENEVGYEKFDAAIDKALDLIDSRLEQSETVGDSLLADFLFYKGSAYGYRAYHQGNGGQWLAALSNGLKSIGYLNDTLEKDSTYYAAYLGIGVYKYWRYSRLRFISWLPFVPDDREQGIKMIKQAIVLDSLSRYMAMHQLVYILLDYDRMDEAILLAEKITSKYPKSQFMWWAHAHAFYKNGDYNKAEESYLTLYSLIEEDQKRNLSHLLKCNLKLALIYKELDETQKCKDRCSLIMEYSNYEDLTDPEQETISRTVELLEDWDFDI